MKSAFDKYMKAGFCELFFTSNLSKKRSNSSYILVVFGHMLQDNPVAWSSLLSFVPICFPV